jgi:DUF4097 and DUF4098 domain-containing protein YvlB
MLRMLPVTAILAIGLASATLAQSRNQRALRSADGRCDTGWSSDGASYCEVREATIPAVNPLDIDAGTNGGIHVRGWDSTDALVRSRIAGYAETEADARRLVSGVRIVTAGGGVRSEGPEVSRGEHWSVSFEVQVPRTALLTLNAHNGGISIDDFRGTAKFHTQNGGVSLTSVSGDIRGETTNGGLMIDLAGDRWDGAGLDVETRNGGIRLTVPKDYSAELEAGTIHGGVNADLPVTVTGSLRSRHFSTILGSGGAKLRAITTNGGVTIRQK